MKATGNIHKCFVWIKCEIAKKIVRIQKRLFERREIGGKVEVFICTCLDERKRK